MNFTEPQNLTIQERQIDLPVNKLERVLINVNRTPSFLVVFYLARKYDMFEKLADQGPHTVVQNSQTENVLTICHSKPVPDHTPIFISVTWDASTWLLLRVLFSSMQELRRGFWSFESAIRTQRLRKTAPQSHKN